MGPSWLLDTLAAVMLAVAGLSAARLAAGPAAVGSAPARPGRKAVNGTSTPADGGQRHIDRLRRRGRRRVTDADIDTAHVLMAIAMAGMLVTGLRTLPDGVWAAVFGVLAAWFAGRVLHEARGHGLAGLAGGHHAPHLVHSAAMLYMFLAAGVPGAGGAVSGGGPQMTGMAVGSGAGLRLPTLALVLALALAGYAVRDLDRLTGSATIADLARRTVPAAGPGVGQLAGSAAGPAYPPAAIAALTTVTVPSAAAAAATAQPDRGTASRRSPGRRLAAARQLLIAPRVATGCRIAMGIVMAYMLIIMI